MSRGEAFGFHGRGPPGGALNLITGLVSGDRRALALAERWVHLASRIVECDATVETLHLPDEIIGLL